MSNIMCELVVENHKQEIIDSFQSLGGTADFNTFYDLVIEVIQRHDPTITGLNRNVIHEMYKNLNGAT